jgi:hypothetical protein
VTFTNIDRNGCNLYGKLGFNMAQVLIKLLNYLIKLLKSVGRFKETMSTCLLCRSFGKLIKEYNPCNI